MLIQGLYNSPKQFSSGWNFGPKHKSEKTVLDCVKICQKIWGKNADIIIEESDKYYEANLLKLDTSKSDSLLQIKKKISIEDSIINTLSWYKSYSHAPEDISNLTNQQILRFLEE